MSCEPILAVEHIVKSYRLGKRCVEVLHDVNWRIPRHSWSALLGASGSGKTTLLNILGALERPDAGKVFYDGEEIGRWSKRRAAGFRARELGFIFQSYQLLPELNLLDNVLLPARLTGLNTAQYRAKALELLERFGLADRLPHHPGELSGGEQQRASIARALVKSPKLLLADEPTGNLDSVSGEAILGLLEELRRTEELSIVMITHNSEVAARADAVARLVDGRILADNNNNNATENA